MSIAKVAISIEKGDLKKIDAFVKKKVFKNRSQAFQLSISEMLKHIEHDRLAKECANLDAQFEQELADISLDEDSNEWPNF